MPTPTTKPYARIDLHFRLPLGAGPVIEWYNQLLDVADDVCQQAEYLTFAPTNETLAVRRWGLGRPLCSFSVKQTNTAPEVLA
jgi:hypothetical protein